jgi:hypothetical protein
VLTRDEKEDLRDLSAGDGVLYAGRSAARASLLGLYVLARTALPKTDDRGESIGLSVSTISRKRKPRGSNGMSAKAADVLKWAVASLEDSCPPRSMGFLTLTLPSDDMEFIRACQDNWQSIVKNLVEGLKRELKRNGSIIPTVLGCIESHPSRSSRLSTFVPHLHLVFRCRERAGTPYYITPGSIRRIWKRVVERATGISGYDFSASENLVLIRRSLRRYLAKYLSKGTGGDVGGGSTPTWFPSSYTIVPRLIRAAYRSMTIRSARLVEPLEDAIARLRPGTGYVRFFELDIGGRKVVWSRYGILDELYRPPPSGLVTSNVVRKQSHR